MIVKFSDIEFDTYGKIEQPVLFLKTLAGQSIRPITDYYNLHAHFAYNDVSEITFNITDKSIIDDQLVENQSYNAVVGDRLVEMEPFGSFVLVNPEISDDGIKKVKSCTAYSLEYELNFKYIPPLSESESGYMFYDSTGLKDQYSLMDIVMSKIPNWTLGHVDPSVCTRVREFSNSSESVYSFLMNTVQETFNCLFVYDTKNRIINVYDAADDVRIENLPIYLSKENLINEVQLKELSEDIVTSLSVYGADDLSIIEVNPLGNERIYNLDYFIEIGDIPSPIDEKWKKWQSDVKTYQKLYANIHSRVYTDQIAYNTQDSLLTELQNELDAEQTVLSTYNADKEIKESSKDAIDECKDRIKSLEDKIDSQEKVVATAKSNLEKSQKMQSDIISMCQFENYFEDYEIAILNQFFKEGSIQDSAFVATNVALTPDACKSVTYSDNFKVQITKGDLYKAEEYVELTSEEKEDLNLDSNGKAVINEIESEVKTYLNQNFYTINIGSLSITNEDKSFSLTGTVKNSTVSYENEPLSNGNYQAVVTFSISSPVYNEEQYKTGTFVAIGEINSFKYNSSTAEKDTMSFNFRKGILTLTCQNTTYQKMETIQQLYDYGKVCSEKLAYPSYEFSIKSSNFIFSQQFEKFKNMIELGKSINVEFNDNYFRRPILIGLEIDYDDLRDFTLEFSNKFRTNSPEFLLADVIGKTATTTSNLDASKFSYAAYSNSTIQNDVTELIEGVFDVSKRQIVNAKNQNFLIDDAGVHLRKLTDVSTNTFSPSEIRLINNQIVFTRDGWDSVGLAIGEMNVGGGTFMGVVADSLIGKALIGNQLTVEANRINEDGSSGVMTFRVDGQGAYLGNGAIYMETPLLANNRQGKMAIDPRFGIIAGHDEVGKENIFTMDGNGATVKLDSNGQFILDEFGMPEGSSFFLDINSNSAFFRGSIYATEGYFAGTVSANTIVERKDNTGTLPDGSIGKIQETASTAKTTADEALEYAKSVGSVAGGKNSVYYQTSKPTGTNHKINDMWFDTNDGYKLYYWNGSSWVAGQFGASAIAEGAITASHIVSGTITSNHINSNTVISNELKATKGSIGGWTIGNDKLYASGDIGYSIIQPPTSEKASTIAVGVSEDEFNDGNYKNSFFRVTRYGNVILKGKTTGGDAGGGILYCYDDSDVTPKDEPTAEVEAKIRVLTNNKTTIGGTDYFNRLTYIYPNRIYMRLIAKNSTGTNIVRGGSIYLGYNASDSIKDDDGNKITGQEGTYFKFSRPIDIGDEGIKGTDGHVSLFRFKDNNDIAGAKNLHIGVDREYCYNTIRTVFTKGRDLNFYAFGTTSATNSAGEPNYTGTIKMYGRFTRSIYLGNGVYLRGMKSGQTNAIAGTDEIATGTESHTNIIAYVNSNNNVVLGHPDNSNNTYITSGNSVYIGCEGSSSNSERKVIELIDYKNDGGYYRTSLQPTYNTSDGSSYTDLGSSNNKWRYLYAQYGTIQTSDRNAKKDIEILSDEYIKAFDLLTPVSYRFLNGDRKHIGFVAQDVEEAFEKNGLTSMDFGGICKDIKTVYSEEEKMEVPVLDEDGNLIYSYSLRYDEFIALNTAKIKQLEQIILQLKEEIETIKSKENS